MTADEQRLAWINQRITVLLNDAEHLNLEARQLAIRIYGERASDRGHASDGAPDATTTPLVVACRPDLGLPLGGPGGTPSTTILA